MTRAEEQRSKKVKKKKKEKNTTEYDDALSFLVSVVRDGEITQEEDKIIAATLPQRMAAAQMLLRLKGKDKEGQFNNKTESGNLPYGVDFPERSKTFEEWLDRVKRMQAEIARPKI